MGSPLGAHLSIGKGLPHALQSIYDMGGSCLQVFSSSPRTWQKTNISDETIASFQVMREKLDIHPMFFHANYLINLADDGATGEKSVSSLICELEFASRMKVLGSVVHTGSFKSKSASKSIRQEERYPTLIAHIKHILSHTPKDTYLILENAGNRKIGQYIEHLSEIIEDSNDSRVRVCLDTCHLHATGYDLRDEATFHSFMAKFDAQIGLERLAVIHMNDSKDRLGDLRDRHENIGEGHVGMSVFEHFLNAEETRNIPKILETPGFDGNGPDKKNIDIIKRLTSER